MARAGYYSNTASDQSAASSGSGSYGATVANRAGAGNSLTPAGNQYSDYGSAMSPWVGDNGVSGYLARSKISNQAEGFNQAGQQKKATLDSTTANYGYTNNQAEGDGDLDMRKRDKGYLEAATTDYNTYNSEGARAQRTEQLRATGVDAWRQGQNYQFGQNPGNASYMRRSQWNGGGY